MPRRRPSARPPTYAKRPAPNKDIEAVFAAAMMDHAGPIAVAVSGGSDSLALMHLLRGFAKIKKQPPPIVLTPAPQVAVPAAVESPAAVPVAATSETVVKPIEVLPTVKPSASPPPAVEKTPPPVANAVPAAAPVTPNSETVVEPVAVTPPSDPVAQRAPTPVNAEP